MLREMLTFAKLSAEHSFLKTVKKNRSSFRFCFFFVLFCFVLAEVARMN